ncbi:hypothetical protein [uncultured Bacteroides sp.]|uniref:hypothetical protein n=1 Tax=uncultured Bacteroides sp. TaxID=162156 RepID=UPI002AAC0681|nr:hypothetical protein [uncultured Bacteroides sp.]
MKAFKGKAIYNPSGKAGEYSAWACNFFVGCSNGCKYCYLKKGIGAKVLGGNAPILKKCFKDEKDALDIFEKEVLANVDELRKHGIFFTFTSDPMLPETISLTFDAIGICFKHNVPVKVLTKRSDWWDMWYARSNMFVDKQHLIAFGFTLTGADELEPNASPNMNRILAMTRLQKAGFKTWASIEPIVDLDSSFKMIVRSMGSCDLYKIGLESGKKYDKKELLEFISSVMHLNNGGKHLKIYFKDRLLKMANIDRSSLLENCVDRDYDMFQDK